VRGPSLLASEHGGWDLVSFTYLKAEEKRFWLAHSRNIIYSKENPLMLHRWSPAKAKLPQQLSFWQLAQLSVQWNGMGGEWRNGGTEGEERMKLAKQKGNRGSCAIKPITKCSN